MTETRQRARGRPLWVMADFAKSGHRREMGEGYRTRGYQSDRVDVQTMPLLNRALGR